MKGQSTLFSRASDEWETPQDLFDALNASHGFTLDVCATAENAKCKKFFTEQENGLEQSWRGEVVWCNPPYSKIAAWVAKAVAEKTKVVMLIPARTDTKWFHDNIYNNDYARVQFLRGRLKFSGSKNSAPFPSMIVEFY